MLSTAHGFLKGKRVTDHDSLFALEAVSFSQVSLGYNVVLVQRNIFTNRKFITIYVRSNYTGKRSFCKNVNFDSVPLALHGGSCFSASLSTLCFVNLFCI